MKNTLGRLALTEQTATDPTKIHNNLRGGAILTLPKVKTTNCGLKINKDTMGPGYGTHYQMATDTGKYVIIKRLRKVYLRLTWPAATSRRLLVICFKSILLCFWILIVTVYYAF